ncbi:MAG TPA: hypothetical protein PL065_22565, partial [Polyangiaceae bacterium]|nr:hypothetical protein [Polyangiaceae bacterium]
MPGAPDRYVFLESGDVEPAPGTEPPIALPLSVEDPVFSRDKDSGRRPFALNPRFACSDCHNGFVG